MNAKYVRESRAIKAAIVLPPDTNHHGTMFGGKVMAYIDDLAGLSATRHARRPVVTASTDSVDFLHPVRNGESVCLEAFVTWTHKTSIEVFVKVVAEDLLSGERNVCTTAFLTFVAVDPEGNPQPVPAVIPETELERFLHEGAPARAEVRRKRRGESKELAARFGV
jgi:acyl-CoA hydrolase